MKTAYFYGYTIYENGQIQNTKTGKIIAPNRKANGRVEIKLAIGNGIRKSFVLARIVYYAFYPFDIDDKNKCVSFLDDDKSNVNLSNLYLVDRKDLIQGEAHKTITKIPDHICEQIRADYDKSKSGTNQFDKTGYSLNDLAKKYGVTKANIAIIVRGESRNKDSYILK